MGPGILAFNRLLLNTGGPKTGLAVHLISRSSSKQKHLIFFKSTNMWLMAYTICIDSNQTVACDILLSKIYPAYPSDDAKITVIQ